MALFFAMTEKLVEIISGKYKGCIGKIVYEYKHFKGYYLVKIIQNPNKSIYEWHPEKEIVVTKNNIRELPEMLLED